MNDVVGGGEFIESQPAVAAAGSILVIRHHCPDSVTIERVGALAFWWTDVPAEHKKQIRVALKRIINGLALRAKGCIESLVNDPVANDNRPAILVGL